MSRYILHTLMQYWEIFFRFLSHRNSFFGDFMFLSIVQQQPPIIENNRTKLASTPHQCSLSKFILIQCLAEAWRKLGGSLAEAWPSLTQLGISVIHKITQLTRECYYAYEMNHFLLSVTFVQKILDNFNFISIFIF